MIPNDADIEMAEMAERAAEDLAETCRACGAMYESITVFVSAFTNVGPHCEAYECSCGHLSVWIDGRRAS